MPDLRKIYQAVPQGPEGAKIPHDWKPAQGLLVSPNKPFGWNHFTTHLTIEQWDVKDKVKRIKRFHLSFKEWKGKPMSGPGLKQPGCTWEWNSATSTFQCKGWFEVPSLYLKTGENQTIATKANEFIRQYVDALLLDRFMWAALGSAPPP
jgi:hypothetical protein